jgi:hypothetical protein
MNLEQIKNVVTSKVARQILLGKKHSPTILFVAGSVGVVTSTVLACRATPGRWPQRRLRSAWRILAATAGNGCGEATWTLSCSWPALLSCCPRHGPHGNTGWLGCW